MPKHEELTAIRAAVEARLLPVLDILRAPSHQQRTGRGHDLVDRFVRPSLHLEGPPHVVTRAGNEAVQAHQGVPHDLAHLGYLPKRRRLHLL